MKQVKKFALGQFEVQDSNYIFTLQGCDGFRFKVSNNDTPAPNHRERINLSFDENNELEAVYIQGVKFLPSRKDRNGITKLQYLPLLPNIGVLPAIFRHRMQFFREFVPGFENHLYQKEFEGCQTAIKIYEKFYKDRDLLLTEGALEDMKKLANNGDEVVIDGNPRDFSLCMAMAMCDCEPKLFEKSKKDILSEIENSIILMMPLIGDLENRKAQPRAELIRLYLQTQTL